MKHAKTIVPLVSLMLLIWSASAIAADNRGSVVRIKSKYDGATLHKKYTTGTNHALIIGINQYSNHPDLKTAVNDAEEVADLLEKKYFFDQENIIFLKNKLATKARIIMTFDDLLADKIKKKR